MWNKLILKYCILAGESRTSHHNAYLGRHREDRLQKDAHVFLELRARIFLRNVTREKKRRRPPSHHHRPTLYHLQLTHTVPSSSPVRGIRARVGTLSGRRRLAGTAAARAPRARHARRASLLF